MAALRSTILLSALLLFATSVRVEAATEVRQIEIAKGAIFRSQLVDLTSAWTDCADAVEGRDLRTDHALLVQRGWQQVAVTANGKPVASSDKGVRLYLKPEVKALISADSNTCVVEGLVADPAIRTQVAASITDRVMRIASARRVKFETWVTDGPPRFSATPFVAVISQPKNSYVQLLSSTLEDMAPVRILTADAFRSKQ